MATFPTMASGSMKVSGPLLTSAIAMFPSTLNFGFVTRTIKFLSDQEQRWTVRGELFSALLEYKQVNGYDLAVLTAFFRSMKGAYVDPALTNTFSITIDGHTYSYCVFDQDDLTPTVSRSESFSFQLKIKQIRPN